MLNDIMIQLRPAIVATVVFTIITGLAYPLFVYGAAQVLFPRQANGSMIERDGKAIGSELIGQQFSDPKYFWGRISATTKPYDAANSSGSNNGPLKPDLIDAVSGRIKDLKDADPDAQTPVPVDLVTSSASGIDPEISPAAAEYQVRRVAKARSLDEAKVREIVAAHTEQRQFGVLGEPRINVLKLNLALDVVHK